MRAREPAVACLHADTPSRIARVPFSARRELLRWWSALRGEKVENATEGTFCSIHRATDRVLFAVQHAIKPPTNPVKSTTHATHTNKPTN